MVVDFQQSHETISTALENGKFNDAARICRNTIRQLEHNSNEIELVNKFRSSLIACLVEMHQEAEPLDMVVAEFDQLFVGFLSVQDKASAANILVEKMNFLKEKDWSYACTTAEKVVELFAQSNDELVMEVIIEAYVFLYEEIDLDDANYFIDVCTSLGKFLQRYGEPDDSADFILEIANALDGDHNVYAILILEEFLNARLAKLSLDAETRLRDALAANYLYIGRFEDAVNTLNWLFINAKYESLLDYFLWCGEAYTKLGRDNVAAMYFREVKRALVITPGDGRAKAANIFLEEINLDTSEDCVAV